MPEQTSLTKQISSSHWEQCFLPQEQGLGTGGTEGQYKQMSGSTCSPPTSRVALWDSASLKCCQEKELGRALCPKTAYKDLRILWWLSSLYKTQGLSQPFIHQPALTSDTNTLQPPSKPGQGNTSGPYQGAEEKFWFSTLIFLPRGQERKGELVPKNKSFLYPQHLCNVSKGVALATRVNIQQLR